MLVVFKRIRENNNDAVLNKSYMYAELLTITTCSHHNAPVVRNTVTMDKNTQSILSSDSIDRTCVSGFEPSSVTLIINQTKYLRR